jgi:hypothetical protein
LETKCKKHKRINIEKLEQLNVKNLSIKHDKILDAKKSKKSSVRMRKPPIICEI